MGKNNNDKCFSHLFRGLEQYKHFAENNENMLGLAKLTVLQALSDSKKEGSFVLHQERILIKNA